MFSIRLEQTRTNLPRATDEAQQALHEAEDALGALAVICDSMEDTSCVAFHVTGFGQAPWPVDVRTDLLTVLEQTPGLLKSIHDGSIDTFSLDFYEQGIERRVVFRKNGPFVDARCESRTRWTPSVETETMTVADLGTMVEDVTRTFISCSDALFPGGRQHPGYRTWISQVEEWTTTEKP